MTRLHTKSNINMLLTKKLPIESDVRHPLMIPLHSLWAKSNKRTCGQFEYDVTWFCFVSISFVHMHGAAVVS